MYELIITEKPAAAKKIAEALADNKAKREVYNKKIPYYKLTHDGKEIVVTCAVGHLYGLAEKKKEGWVYPVYDIEWKPTADMSKASAFTKPYLLSIKNLAKDADEFTVATDYDIEGEVIGLNVIKYACKQKDANRMKFSTLMKEDLIEAYEHKAKTLDWGQAHAGETRHMLDWFYGINTSRALTSAIKTAGMFKLMSSGRVQGPALKLVVDKEKEIQAFKSVPYWQIQLLGETEKKELDSWHVQKIKEQKIKKIKELTEKIIKLIKHNNNDITKKLINKIESSKDIIKQARILTDEKSIFLKNLEESKKADFNEYLEELEKLIDTSRFWKQKEAKGIYDKIHKEKTAVIDSVEKKKFDQSPPTPFDLTSLQIESHRALRIAPKRTLEIAQDLYTAGYISYPRTSSQKLPAKLGFTKIITALGRSFEKEAKLLLAKKSLTPNEGKKSDPAHPAIYPTGTTPNLKDKDAMDLYELIARRFLATFGDKAVRETMHIKIDCKGEMFLTKGTTTVEPGWHVLYGRFTPAKEEELPAVEKGQVIAVKKIELHEKETQPPKRFTEASIIKELEKKNLGTKATRASILDTLFQRDYVEGKQIKATELGMRTINTLEKYNPDIIDEHLTKEFEEDMEKIREGTEKEEDVLAKARKVLDKIMKTFKKKEKEIGKELAAAQIETRDELSSLGPCHKCKEGILQIRRGKFGLFVACNKYPDCKTTFGLPANALVKPAKKICETCDYPMILVIKAKKRPQEVCINPKCPSKLEGYSKEQLKEMEDIESGELEKECPKCKIGKLKVRKSVYGSFIACDQYPKCRYIEPLQEAPSKEDFKEKS